MSVLLELAERRDQEARIVEWREQLLRAAASKIAGLPENVFGYALPDDYYVSRVGGIEANIDAPQVSVRDALLKEIDQALAAKGETAPPSRRGGG